MKCPYCSETMLLENASIYLDYDDKTGKQSKDKYYLNLNYKCTACSFFGSLRKPNLTYSDAVVHLKTSE